MISNTVENIIENGKIIQEQLKLAKEVPEVAKEAFASMKKKVRKVKTLLNEMKEASVDNKFTKISHEDKLTLGRQLAFLKLTQGIHYAVKV